MWVIYYRDINDRECQITIGNGSDTEVELVPSASPFVASIEDDDDVFKPSRLSSGNIGIICDDITTIQSIIATDPLQRPVKVECDQEVVWQGFVKCEAFSQRLWGKNEEISIPVMSSISALEGVMVSEDNWPENATMANIIKKSNDILGEPYYDVVMPSEVATKDYMTPVVNMYNYVEMIDINDLDFTAATLKTYNGKPYLNALNDICTYYGWTMVEHGDTLMFLCLDKDEDYMKTSMTNLVSETPGWSAYRKQTTSINTTNMTFNGTQHEISVVPGKKSVSVSASLNKADGTIISLNDILKRTTRGGKNGGPESIGFTKDGNYYNIFSYRLLQGDNTLITNEYYLPSEGASDYVTVQAQNNNTTASKAHGCFIEEEGSCSVLDAFYGWNNSCMNPCIILRRDPISTSYNTSNYASMKKLFMVPTMPVDSSLGEYVKISCNVQIKKDTITTDWQTGDVYIRVYYEGTWHVVKCNGGKCEIYIPAADATGNFGLAPLGMNEHSGTWTYARIDGFSVEYFTNYTKLGSKVYDDNSEYKSKKEIGKGFTEEYSIDCGLAGKRTKAYGYGVVDNNVYTVNPEEALCQRAYNYYKQSKMRLTLIIESDSYLDQAKSWMYGGKTYNILGQELNSSERELKIILQEIAS